MIITDNKTPLLYAYQNGLNANTDVVLTRAVRHILYGDEYATGDVDEYWGNVVSLLHFNSDFTDIKSNTWTSTGSPVISTTQYKLGQGSAFFNGSSYITTSSSSSWAFGTGDFTIEAWVYITTTALSWEAICGNFDNATQGSWSLWRDNGGGIGFAVHGQSFVGGGTVPSNEWVHMAVSRNGSNLRLFLNGQVVQNDTSYGSVNVSASTGIRVGANYVSADNFNGYIDELRITKGVGRYQSNFTPKTSEFPSL